MNLIEIAEDLKDVPDQYLMQEIQQPTGNFPSYLVVSELSRRKRMREKVAKEMPTQTVAEELATPPQPQMPPQMPQGMPPQAGLMAMPQAQTELAAQDAMGTTPPEMMMPTQQMAGGGMVSFKQGGDVIRAFDGLPSSMFPDSVTTEEDVEAYRPRGFGSMFGLMPEGVGSGNIDYELVKLGYPREQLATMDPATKRYIVANASAPSGLPAAVTPAAVRPAVAPGGAPAPSGAPGAAPAPRAVVPQIPMAPAVELPVAMTPAQLQDIRTRGTEAYEQAVPDRLTPFISDTVSRREKEIEGRRGSNINEALIQAGLGIMGSKSPRFLQAASEGGLSALKSYREGAKDIRQSEEALLAARSKMVEAQMLRDDKKFKAADDAERRALELEKLGVDRANTQSAINLRTLQANLAAQEAPAKISLLEAQAEYARSGGRTASADNKAADEYAQRTLTMSGVLPNSPNYMSEYARLRNEYLKNIAGGGGVTQIPVAPAGGAGGARFVGFEGS